MPKVITARAMRRFRKFYADGLRDGLAGNRILEGVHALRVSFMGNVDKHAYAAGYVHGIDQRNKINYDW